MALISPRPKVRAGRRKRPASPHDPAQTTLRPPKAARLLAEMQERETLHGVSLERAAVGIAHIALDRRYLQVNDAFCAMLGYRRDELLSKTYRDITAPGDLEPSDRRFSELLSGDVDVLTSEKQYLRKDSTPIWVSVTSSVVRSARGQPSYFLSVIVDIEERKRIERELARHAGLLDHAYDAIISWEFDGPITYWNQGASRLYGYSKDEAIGQVSHELLQTKHPVPISDYLAELATNGSWEGELSHVHRDGAWIEVESRAVLVRSGDRPFVIEANRDVTDRARFKRALQASEEQFRLLAESLPQVVFTADADGSFGYVNSGWLSFTGLDVEESLGVGWTQFIHPTDRDAVVNQWRTAVASGQSFESEFRLRAARGGWRWFLAKAVAVRDRSGRVFKWVGAGTDITERHHALLSLKRSEARFRRLFDANLFGVVFWSETGQIVAANDAFLTMLGYGRAALDSGELGAITLSRREPDDSGVAPGPYETWFAHRDGRRVPVIVAETETPGDGGERFTIVVDLTEREARERFEQDFLGDVAHDLRNPLAATKAQAQVMRRRLKTNRLEPDSLADGLDTIIANSTRMARRLEELTDVAQLRAGHALEFAHEPVDLVAMAERSVEIYRQATERQEMRVESSVPSLVGSWDAGRIERVIDNLLSNAVKYSPEGGPIVVRIDREGEEARAFARLSVQDQGVGIPADDVAGIFERFQRGSNVKGRMSGTGIGLAGARTIVEQHGGSIEVASELGAGSVFTVHLPLAVTAPEPDDATHGQASA